MPKLPRRSRTSSMLCLNWHVASNRNLESCLFRQESLHTLKSLNRRNSPPNSTPACFSQPRRCRPSRHRLLARKGTGGFAVSCRSVAASGGNGTSAETSGQSRQPFGRTAQPYLRRLPECWNVAPRLLLVDRAHWRREDNLGDGFRACPRQSPRTPPRDRGNSLPLHHRAERRRISPCPWQ